ncbi:reverse transcriptase [Plakobranchus ocellatus]|uniref:Reverse transcriptase n=1 Tax=Plakobranchus ocellatus TaxID=259542 RepID=A0AAV4AQ77_9GAST|nr:reverse transcriptase [Plakobranchus ocellatus]
MIHRKGERIVDQLATLRSRLGKHKGPRDEQWTMDYLCICGRRFCTEKGMKIHRTKMKCLDNSKDHQQRSAQADKTSESQGLEQNHSTEEIQASDPDEKFRQLLNAKK